MGGGGGGGKREAKGGGVKTIREVGHEGGMERGIANTLLLSLKSHYICLPYF